MQEIVYLIQTGDFATACEVQIGTRAPYLEFGKPEDLDDVPSPRLIRSHLPLQLLPEELMEKKPKVFVTAVENGCAVMN